MAFATRVGDPTMHGGTVLGPGCATVLIAGKPAALLGDVHGCALHAPTPFLSSSSSVVIGGRLALRMGDSCACGSVALLGQTTVIIG